MSPIARAAALATVLLLATGAAVGVPLAAHANYANDPAPTWVPNGPVQAVAVSGDTVYLGGSFTRLSDPATGESESHANIAAIDTATGEPVPGWSATADDAVSALAVSRDGTRVFVGGSFLAIDGQPQRRLAALSTTNGSLVSPWGGSAAGTVRDLLVVGQTLYVGGSFAQLNGVEERGLGALRVSDGARVAGFSAEVDETVYALASSGTRLLASGDFTTVNGAPRASVAALGRSSGALQSWSPPRLCTGCGTYWDVTTDGQRVYVASSGPGGRAAAFDYGSGARRWVQGADGDVQALTLSDGTLYVGGHFNKNFGGQPRFQLAAANPATGAVDRAFAPRLFDPYPGVKALAASPTALYAGGYFSEADGKNDSPYFATFPATP